jgi:uncharacterized membrane protein
VDNASFLVGFEAGFFAGRWPLGFLMERLESRLYAVFVPGAPNVWSGSVCLMAEERFQRLDITRAEALKYLRRLGVGANTLVARKTDR